ncbi:hypothetical protein [Streptomyces sp. NPDC127119]|uniref:hypothetical protein n=1 Tax=Streptomyces sp. NPDC127119 TaxID=3345370 RepID=UPI00362A556F
MPWRSKRVELLPLSRLRACYLRTSESHDIESLNFSLVYDTDTVLIGINRQYYEGDAHWFAKYLREAIRERLRRVFKNWLCIAGTQQAVQRGLHIVGVDQIVDCHPILERALHH